MKKVILGALALILAVALVAVGYVLLTGCDLQSYTAPDAPCPYSWQEQRSGSIRLEIDTTAQPDCSWTVECYPKNVAAVSAAEADPGKAAFSILPLNMGQAYIQVTCSQTGLIAVPVFEIGMQVAVTEEGTLSVEETVHQSYDGIIQPEDAPAGTRWWADPDGAVNLLLPVTGTDWKALDYDPDRLEIAGPFYREDSCAFEIRGKLAGSFPLTFCNSEHKAFFAELAVAQDLSAVITKLSEGVYAPDRGPEHSALEQAMDTTITLPPQAVATGYSLKRTSGTVTFLLNDAAWDWQISSDDTVERRVADLIANPAETATADMGGLTVTAYRFSDGVVAVWRDGTHVMALHGDRGTALADLLAVAAQITVAHG